MERINYTIKGQAPSTKTKSSGLTMNAFTVIGLGGLALFLLSFALGKGNALSGNRFTLFLLAITFFNLGVSAAGKKIREPFEIQFYPEYLIVFRERHHFDGANPRSQFEKFYYKTMKQCIWDRGQKKLIFLGQAEVTGTEYDEEGNLKAESTFAQFPEYSCVIRTEYAANVDFKTEIEKNAPLRVTVY